MSKALWGLDKLDLFKGLNAMEMQEIAKIVSKVRYNKGDVVAGETNTRDVFMLIDGSVDIMSLGGVPLYRISKNEVFGELALISSIKRSAVAVCHEDSWILVMNINHLEKLGEEFPNIYQTVFLNLVQSLGIKLARANKLIELLKTELGKALKPRE
jgi:signal-transduction protein with cAMP-binding, CBS, and nucleotidyltransferase domain